MVEFRESLKIVRAALDGLPAGPISSRPGVKSVGQVRIPKGEAYARVEGARGEVGCYLIADGSAKPYRMKWRGASFSNLSILPHIIPGHKVADVVAIMGSVDPVFGEVDRARALRDRFFVVGFIGKRHQHLTYVTLLERKFAARMSRAWPHRGTSSSASSPTSRCSSGSSPRACSRASGPIASGPTACSSPSRTRSS
jgi:hypothetical protein